MVGLFTAAHPVLSGAGHGVLMGGAPAHVRPNTRRMWHAETEREEQWGGGWVRCPVASCQPGADRTHGKLACQLLQIKRSQWASRHRSRSRARKAPHHAYAVRVGWGERPRTGGARVCSSWRCWPAPCANVWRRPATTRKG